MQSHGRALGHVAILLACAGLAASAPARHHPGKVPLAPPTLAPGDVVFIGVDRAFWAQAASRFSAHGYGHVGIAARGADGRILIVHAGGSPADSQAPVLAVPEAQFLREADRVGIYRPHGNVAQRAAAGERALEFVRDGARFDAGFSLDTTRELYCSELVWRALLSGLNRDPVPEKTWILGEPGVSLADLEESPLLEAVASISRRAK